MPVSEGSPPPPLSLLLSNVGKALRGKPEVVKFSVVALLARGHLLLEDVPGVGKTTLAQALARSVACTFRRIQFTSDLLPSDIIGVPVYRPERGEFDFIPGPIFAQFVLADEINRTTPKTQSSLLEAMNEGQVTVENQTYPLPRPFMVIATQNPMEFHGTYPLPESQLDRFMMRLSIGYPERADEREILLKPPDPLYEIKPVLSASELTKFQDQVEEVRLDPLIADYILALVVATRDPRRFELGVSTRCALFLQRAARALALLSGRDFVLPEDVKTLAPLIFPHRVVARSGSADSIVREIVSEVPIPL